MFIFTGHRMVGKLVFVFTVLYSSLLPVSPGLDVCSSTHLQHDALQRCFDDAGVDYVIPLNGNLQQADLDHYNINAICKNSTAFKRGRDCAMNVTRTCAPPDIIKILPSEAGYTKSVTYLCQHQADMNFPCIKKHFTSITNCASQAVRDNSTQAPDFGKDFVQATCLTMVIANNCASSFLRDCGLKSRITYRTYNDLLTPDVCRLNKPIIG